METIGLLGGMSWESTALYYKLINQMVSTKLGGLHSAKILLSSVDFHEIEQMQAEEQWEDTADLLSTEAKKLESAGSGFIVLCTNTMHIIADKIQNRIDIPLLHLADATAEAIQEKGISKVGLLGTKFTMEKDFYKIRLENRGIQVVVPNENDREIVHRVIYDELCKGKILDNSRREFLRIMDGLRTLGAEGVIEGCTEIVTLVQECHANIPLFDTTSIHAKAAVKKAFSYE